MRSVEATAVRQMGHGAPTSRWEQFWQEQQWLHGLMTIQTCVVRTRCSDVSVVAWRTERTRGGALAV